MAEQQAVIRTLRLIAALRRRSRTFKQIQELLADNGAGSRASAYRYIELIEELNLTIIRKKGLYSIEDNKNRIPFQFNEYSEEEVNWLKTTLEQAAFDHPFTASILKKMAFVEEGTKTADFFIDQQLTRNRQKLLDAISRKVCVKLKNYYSLNSNTTRTRLVEPKQFDDKWLQIVCFDLEKGLNRSFRIERIEEVEVLEQVQSNEILTEQKDIFGFAGSEVKGVSLRMTEKAQQLLIEHFPNAQVYIRYEGGGKYLFSGHYTHLEGISRFILGLPHEIEILRPIELRDHLNKLIENLKW